MDVVQILFIKKTTQKVQIVQLKVVIHPNLVAVVTITQLNKTRLEVIVDVAKVNLAVVKMVLQKNLIIRETIVDANIHNLVVAMMG